MLESTVWRRALFGQALLFCLSVFPVHAQRGTGVARAQASSGARNSQKPADGSQPYTISVTARRVVLDVVVTDSHHNAVRGLTQNDFAVFEDNQPQAIRSFEAEDFTTPSGFVAPKLPPLPPDTYVNVAMAPETGPLYVIVYDAVNMEPEDQPQARKQLQEFLASKPEGTRFALFLLAQDFRLLQGFTTDPNKLLESFDQHRKDGHIPLAFLYGANFGAADVDLPYEVMAFVGHYLEGLPGRKNLIWLSSKFPEDVPLFAIQNMMVGNVMAPGSGSPLQAQGFDGSAPSDMGSTWSEEMMHKAVDALNAAQVSVYPIDVAGLKPGLNGIDTRADHIAQATGGHAYYNTNDFRGAMTEATADGGSYYEISYDPTNRKEDGSTRHIRVALDQKGYSLAYRQYYFAEDPDAPVTNDEKKAALAVVEDHPVAHLPGDSMFAYMEHGAPADHDILFRAQFHAGRTAMASADQMANLVEQPAYFVVRKKNKPVKLPSPIPLTTYTIDYLVLDRNAQNRTRQQVLEFAAGAYDSMGKLLNGISQNAARTQAPVNTKQEPFFRAEQTLDVPTSATWLRVAVRDVTTDRIGTMEIPLPLASEQKETASAK